MIIFNTSPFWASILGYIILKESMKMYEVAAIVVSFGGVVLIALSKPDGNQEAAEDSASDAGLS